MGGKQNNQRRQQQREQSEVGEKRAGPDGVAKRRCRLRRKAEHPQRAAAQCQPGERWKGVPHLLLCFEAEIEQKSQQPENHQQRFRQHEEKIHARLRERGGPVRNDHSTGLSTGTSELSASESDGWVAASSAVGSPTPALSRLSLRVREYPTRIPNPSAVSTAASAMMNSEKSCPCTVPHNRENAIRFTFTAVSISAIDIRMITGLRRNSAPPAPIKNSAKLSAR